MEQFNIIATDSLSTDSSSVGHRSARLISEDLRSKFTADASEMLLTTCTSEGTLRGEDGSNANMNNCGRETVGKQSRVSST
jgi:hypothetical protein